MVEFISYISTLIIMNDEEPPRPYGIDINITAPQIDTKDIYNNPVNLYELLKNFDGVLIDFFRGNW